MNIVNKALIVSCLLISCAQSYAKVAIVVETSLDGLSARELQERSRKACEDLRFWEDRAKNALPKYLLQEERRRAAREEQTSRDRVTALEQQKREIENELPRARRQAELAAAHRQALQQRSTSEKASRKRDEARKIMVALRRAHFKLSWLERAAYPLANC